MCTYLFFVMHCNFIFSLSNLLESSLSLSLSRFVRLSVSPLYVAATNRLASAICLSVCLAKKSDRVVALRVECQMVVCV